MPEKKKSTKPSVRVRMYRYGLGDCLLVTMSKKGGGSFHMLIDCGLIQSAKKEAIRKLEESVEDIAETTGGKIDVLVATHEHWDHVSGFHQAKKIFEEKIEVREIWLAWTENPRDPQAEALRKGRALAIAGLENAVKTLRAVDGPQAGAASDRADGVERILEFFGAGESRTGQALETLRGLSKSEPRYCRPSDPPWTSKQLPGLRIYTLGPPQKREHLMKTIAKSEIYEVEDGDRIESAFFAAIDAAKESSAEEALGAQPFEATSRVDLSQLRELCQDPKGKETSLGRFFGRYYYGEDPSSPYPDQSWRRIDADWLGAAEDLALRLDSATNNTSLVLAIELVDSGKVLLFAADAQVGSWLSWHELSWDLPNGKRVTGTDLLSRTVFYKVGHHGSHNATLKEKGLELMTSDELVAFITVDKEMADANRWFNMPLPSLVGALNERTAGRVVRIDTDYDKSRGDPHFAKRLKADNPLFYEYELI
jgi:hypothetical protein